MKTLKKLLPMSVAAAVIATSGISAAQAEVGASVGVASTYLWRGYDLGSGTPAVSGDLNYSVGGAYAGVWGSSGDTSLGTEYDLYAGYGMEFDMFSFDVSVWNYNYPTGDSEIDFADLTDVVVSLGVGPVSFAVYTPVAGAGDYDYAYYTLGAGYGAFSATLGMHENGGTDEDGDTTDPVHLNLDYAYNDNLTFTLSQFISDEPEGDDLKFVVSYSLPISM